MVLDQAHKFIAFTLTKLAEMGIDVSSLDMDHIGYQAASETDYDKLKTDFDAIGRQVSEVVVGGRRVGIYQLNQPIEYMQYTIPAVELIAPKVDQNCPSALEHVEFVIIQGFDEFMNRYPAVPWDTSAINQPDFPMIKVKTGDFTQVKFHLTPVLKITSTFS